MTCGGHCREGIQDHCGLLATQSAAKIVPVQTWSAVASSHEILSARLLPARRERPQVKLRLTKWQPLIPKGMGTQPNAWRTLMNM